MERNSVMSVLSASVNRRQFLMGTAVVGGALTLAACGSNGSGGAGSSGTSQLITAESDFYSEQLDPIILTGFDKIIDCMFDCPFLVDDSGEPAAGVVTKWKASPDGSSWTLTMRDDVVFHDGTKATAEDLAFSYERSVTPGMDTTDDWVAILGTKPKIDVVDDHTITVHTLGPQPLFVPLSTHLSGIWLVPKAYIESKGVKNFSSNPIGSGPYKFVSHVPGSELNFTAVDHHWRVTPNFKNVKIRLIPNTATAIAELKGGNVDSIGVTPSQAKELKADGYQTIDTEYSQLYFTVVGCYAPGVAGSQPLGDVRVRQALSLAINRQELIDTVMDGEGYLPDPGRASLTMPDVTPALRAKWTAWSKANFGYDPDKAKQLLQEAGYGSGFDLEFWVKQGNSTIPYQETMGPVLAQYWQKIGINVKETVISGDLYGEIGNPATSSKAVNKVVLGNTGLTKASLAENIASVYDPKGAFNGFYGNADLQKQWDAALKIAYSSLDPDTLAKGLNQMLQIEVDSWSTIPILKVPAITAFSKRLDPVLPPSPICYGLGDTYAFWKLKASS